MDDRTPVADEVGAQLVSLRSGKEAGAFEYV